MTEITLISQYSPRYTPEHCRMQGIDNFFSRNSTETTTKNNLFMKKHATIPRSTYGPISVSKSPSCLNSLKDCDKSLVIIFRLMPDYFKTTNDTILVYGTFSWIITKLSQKLPKNRLGMDLKYILHRLPYFEKNCLDSTQVDWLRTCATCRGS